MQGHGTPIYTNFQYPWPITAPYVPAENPTGCYRNWFDIPAAWTGRRYALLKAQLSEGMQKTA